MPQPATLTPSPPQVPDTLDVEVFRVGDYGTRGNYTDTDLEAIATDYALARHEAPVTLDHRQDGPAEGWVTQLRRVGSRLVATLSGLSPQLRAMLATGAYRKRSIELYRAHRDTRRPYLKAVSFLGAAAPEVKGLADPIFTATSDNTIAFTEEVTARHAAPEPTHVFAGHVREQLKQLSRWRPTWETMGLLDIFTALGPGDHSTALLAILASEPPPVAFGAAELIPPLDHEDGLSGFFGEPSPESKDRHQLALSYLATHPASTYAEALVNTSR